MTTSTMTTTEANVKMDRIIFLSELNAKQGGLSPQDLNEVNGLVSEFVSKGEVSAEEVKQSAGQVSDLKAGRIARAWNVSLSLVKKVWHAVWVFLCAIGRGIKAAFGKLCFWTSKKTAAGPVVLVEENDSKAAQERADVYFMQKA